MVVDVRIREVKIDVANLLDSAHTDTNWLAILEHDSTIEIAQRVKLVDLNLVGLWV